VIVRRASRIAAIMLGKISSPLSKISTVFPATMGVTV
jgi:hypothetical protein